MKVSISRIMFLSVLLAFSGQAAAQDDHYWAQQYAALGTLMGGAMVGGVNDNSVSNPTSLYHRGK
jgi:hypothetical protein